MTEAKWLACSDPTPMLAFLRGRANDRKLRLFAVTCCRSMAERARATRLGGKLDRASLRQSIEMAEQIAEGRRPAPSDSDHYYGFYTLFHASGSSLEQALHAATDPSAWDAASGTVKFLEDAMWGDEDAKAGAACLREIFGPLPFRPVTLNPLCLIPNVVSLAHRLYESRDFAGMPILADALQDAGCDSADILDHCRGEEVHVRGCWVIDLILEKS